MPRGTELSDFEKGQIRAFQEIGLSNRDIATRLSRSPTVVDNFIKKKDSYGKKKRSGRRPKLTARDKRSIARAASNSTKGVRWIQSRCVKGYHLENDQIVSPPHQAKAESKPVFETGTRSKPNEFCEAARDMDPQLG